MKTLFTYFSGISRPGEKSFFKRILHSSSWKLIFCLAETSLFQYLKCPLHLKHIFYLLEIYFKRILCCSQWQPTFCLVETIFSHSHFWEALLQLEGGRYFLKNLISVRGNHFRENLFSPVKSHFSRNPSFWQKETDFCIIQTLCFFSKLFSAGGQYS